MSFLLEFYENNKYNNLIKWRGAMIIHSILCFVFGLLLIFNPQLSAEAASLSKQEQWVQMVAETDTWTDRLGMPLDAGIKETVIVLNLLGIKTVQSCEGHLDRGCSYPWVDLHIGNQEYIDLEVEHQVTVQTTLLEIERFEQAHPGVRWWDDSDGQHIQELHAKEYKIRLQIKKLRAQAVLPLHRLLDEFYQNNFHSHDSVLFIEEYGRLQNLGGHLQAGRNPEEVAAKLIEYRQEMERFTEFLKQRFFQEG